MGKVDHTQAVTDQIIAKLESGVAPWRKDWQADVAADWSLPRRVNGAPYRGINVILLSMAGMAKGYKLTQWLTFNAAKENGGMVRKGEKSERVYFPLWLDKEKGNPESPKFFAGYRCSPVFNVEQIDGLPDSFYQRPERAIVDGPARIDSLESFFAATGAKIVTIGNQPLYRPAFDRIEMPAIEQFNSADSYYGTLSHELIHWTGAKSRLDRLGKGKEEYAFEELVAELGAIFLCGTIGAVPDFDNSASYIASWLRALRNDKGFIFKAATAAQRAADFAAECGGIAAETAAA